MAEKANSAALALLLEGLELARKSGCTLEYSNIPRELLELARVSNVEALLVGGSHFLHFQWLTAIENGGTSMYRKQGVEKRCFSTPLYIQKVVC